jgi:hypothetical protein
MTPILGIMASSISGSKISTSAFESIATATGTGSNTAITFSSIPQTYKSLQIRCSILTSASVDLMMDINSTALTYGHRLIGNGTTASAEAGAGDYRILRQTTPSSYNIPLAAIIDIIDYTSTTKNKTVRSIAGCDTNGQYYDRVNLASGFLNNTSAVTSLTLNFSGACNFATGSTVALYGIKG